MTGVSRFTIVSSFDTDASADEYLTNGQHFSRTYSAPSGSGSDAGQADLWYEYSGNLTSSSFDLTLSLLPNGAVLARGTKLYVESLPTSTGTLTVAPSASHGWTNGLGGTQTLNPGSVLALTWKDLAAAIVAAGSNDKLTFAATGSVDLLLYTEGRSA
jgi:hypothetical protein